MDTVAIIAKALCLWLLIGLILGVAIGRLFRGRS